MSRVGATAGGDNVDAPPAAKCGRVVVARRARQRPPTDGGGISRPLDPDVPIERLTFALLPGQWQSQIGESGWFGQRETVRGVGAPHGRVSGGPGGGEGVRHTRPGWALRSIAQEALVAVAERRAAHTATAVEVEGRIEVVRSSRGGSTRLTPRSHAGTDTSTRVYVAPFLMVRQRKDSKRGVAGNGFTVMNEVCLPCALCLRQHSHQCDPDRNSQSIE